MTTQSNENEKFYTDAFDYWKAIPATVDGMLDGHVAVSDPDLKQSETFLLKTIKLRGLESSSPNSRALDCGAGIGRISKAILIPHFQQVDLVELCPSFLSRAQDHVASDRLGQLFCSGLQQFVPDAGCYDVIWCQWVLGHLTDNDLVDFFRRCKNGLKPEGVIIIKENMSSEVDFDEKDSSYSRPRLEWLKLIHLAGLRVLKEEKQRNFPDDLYEVRMIAFA